MTADELARSYRKKFEEAFSQNRLDIKALVNAYVKDLKALSLSPEDMMYKYIAYVTYIRGVVAIPRYLKDRTSIPKTIFLMIDNEKIPAFLLYDHKERFSPLDCVWHDEQPYIPGPQFQGNQPEYPDIAPMIPFEEAAIGTRYEYLISKFDSIAR